MCVPSSEPPWLKVCDLLDCKNMSLLEVYSCFRRMCHLQALSAGNWHAPIGCVVFWSISGPALYVRFSLLSACILLTLQSSEMSVTPAKLDGNAAQKMVTLHGHTYEKFISSCLTELLEQWSVEYMDYRVSLFSIPIACLGFLYSYLCYIFKFLQILVPWGWKTILFQHDRKGVWSNTISGQQI
jgi:hypothetical protein